MKFKVGQKVKIKRKIHKNLRTHTSDDEYIDIINNVDFTIKKISDSVAYPCMCLICQKGHKKYFICESKNINYIRLTECEIISSIKVKINKLMNL